MLKPKTLNLEGETRRHKTVPCWGFCLGDFFCAWGGVCVRECTVVDSSLEPSADKGSSGLVKLTTFMAESWLALANSRLPTDSVSYQISFH